MFLPVNFFFLYKILLFFCWIFVAKKLEFVFLILFCIFFFTFTVDLLLTKSFSCLFFRGETVKGYPAERTRKKNRVPNHPNRTSPTHQCRSKPSVPSFSLDRHQNWWHRYCWPNRFNRLCQSDKHFSPDCPIPFFSAKRSLFSRSLHLIKEKLCRLTKRRRWLTD